MRKIDLSLNKYGRLQPLKSIGKNKAGQYIWLCKCDCGNEKEILGTNIAQGYTKSCGCLSNELSAKRNMTHGLSTHPLFKVWINILDRCNNELSEHYKDYGGRGIKICERWLLFINFYTDTIEDYANGLTIERINNDGNYEPSNYRWATRAEQTRNTRRNVILTYNSVSKTQSEWARELNSYDHKIMRLRKKGLAFDYIVKMILSSDG